MIEQLIAHVGNCDLEISTKQQLYLESALQVSQTENGSACEPKVRGEANGAEAVSAPRDHILHILQSDVATKMLHLLRLLVACPQVGVKLLVTTSQPLHLPYVLSENLAPGQCIDQSLVQHPSAQPEACRPCRSWIYLS